MSEPTTTDLGDAPGTVSWANDNGDPPWQQSLAETVYGDEIDDANNIEEITPSVQTSGLDATITWPEDFSQTGVEVQWGDGSPAEYSDSGATHTYAAAGTYQASVDPFGAAAPLTPVEVTVTDA